MTARRVDAQVRRHRRLLRDRRVHRHAGEALFQRHVCAPRLRGRRAPRSGHPAARRSAGRRRLRLPAQVHELRASSCRRKGATILFVSHNMFSIKTMCERVIYLNKGEIVYDGNVPGGIELYEQDCRGSRAHLDRDQARRMAYLHHRLRAARRARQRRRPCSTIGDRMTLRLKLRRRARPSTIPTSSSRFVRSDGVAVCNYSTELDGAEAGHACTDDGTLELALAAHQAGVGDVLDLRDDPRKGFPEDPVRPDRRHIPRAPLTVQHALRRVPRGPASWRLCETDTPAKAVVSGQR